MNVRNVRDIALDERVAQKDREQEAEQSGGGEEESGVSWRLWDVRFLGGGLALGGYYAGTRGGRCGWRVTK